jgi:hypothetical protein
VTYRRYRPKPKADDPGRYVCNQCGLPKDLASGNAYVRQRVTWRAGVDEICKRGWRMFVWSLQGDPVFGRGVPQMPVRPVRGPRSQSWRQQEPRRKAPEYGSLY